VGTDGSELNYVGHSALIDANGTYAISPINESEGVFTEVISYEKLARFRERFPFLKDADGFNFNS
jgi:predicted amidohydrolase